MSRMMKKCLFVVMLCGAFTGFSANVALGTEKLTLDEMKEITGQGRVYGQTCNGTSNGSCTTAAASALLNNCTETTAIPYKFCITADPKNNDHGWVCSPKPVPSCRKKYFEKVFKDGKYKCSNTQIAPGNTTLSTGC